jgi:hypothetical protein
MKDAAKEDKKSFLKKEMRFIQNGQNKKTKKAAATPKPEQTEEANPENMPKPDLPDQMPHELEEELEALRENEGVINSNDSLTVPQQASTNIDDMINNDPILGKGKKKSNDDDTYKEEFSPLDFF